MFAGSECLMIESVHSTTIPLGFHFCVQQAVHASGGGWVRYAARPALYIDGRHAVIWCSAGGDDPAAEPVFEVCSHPLFQGRSQHLQKQASVGVTKESSLRPPQHVLFFSVDGSHMVDRPPRVVDFKG